MMTVYSEVAGLMESLGIPAEQRAADLVTLWAEIQVKNPEYGVSCIYTATGQFSCWASPLVEPDKIIWLGRERPVLFNEPFKFG